MRFCDLNMNTSAMAERRKSTLSVAKQISGEKTVLTQCYSGFQQGAMHLLESTLFGYCRAAEDLGKLLL
jgi:hypothetical protein